MLASVSLLELILSAALVAMLLMAVSLVKIRKRLDDLSKRFSEHRHDTSQYGSIIEGPAGQRESRLGQLVDAILNTQNQGGMGVQSMRRFVDAKTKP